MKASRFASRVGLSETAAVDEKVRSLRRQGHETINLGVGQPDFPTPAEIGEAVPATLAQEGGMSWQDALTDVFGNCKSVIIIVHFKI